MAPSGSDRERARLKAEYDALRAICRLLGHPLRYEVLREVARMERASTSKIAGGLRKRTSTVRYHLGRSGQSQSWDGHAKSKVARPSWPCRWRPCGQDARTTRTMRLPCRDDRLTIRRQVLAFPSEASAAR
jgi:hypothetical protein